MTRASELSAIYVLFFSFAFFCGNQATLSSSGDDGLLVLTVATSETDGFRRFMRSLNKYHLDGEVLGMGQEWQGGDIVRFAGGGHKVNLLKEAISEYKDRNDLIIMFVDSYDVVFTEGSAAILKAFKKFDARIVFSAEGFCWPDTSLQNNYPKVKMNEKRFLNSGGFIGYAPDIYDMVTMSEIGNQDDDQLFYTNIFLDEQLRKKYSMKLDTRSDIFQNLNGALDDVTLKFKGSTSYMYNMMTGNTPIVIHGNGPIKNKFNRLANYLADQWSPTVGCQACKENVISLIDLKEDELPEVFVGLFIEHPTPFIDHFFNHIAELKYPKSKLTVWIHNSEHFHSDEVTKFVEKHKSHYKSVKVSPPGVLDEWAARNQGVEECLKQSCKYYFSVDSDAQLYSIDFLTLLIEQNRSVLAPVLKRPGQLWSNFWGGLTKEGFYARSEDYIDIAQGKRRGLWNVPYLAIVYLIHGNILELMKGSFVSKYKSSIDSDMAMCENLREKGIFMYVWNEHDLGYLLNADNYNPTEHYHAEMWQIWDNRYDWEMKYIHENYTKYVEPDAEVPMACPDVYWYPMLSETFCKHLIEEMENNGQWSNGQNTDNRLAGGYENVPTRDIHMNQIGFEREWLYMLKEFVQPMQQKVFTGYFHDPPHAIMNFVVRYRIDEQPFLRPHHDSSTYTINVALNRKDIDYQGGGVNFIRYDCKVLSTRMGWVLMHPGRLTHYHEGLSTTGGTRYIMVSFIDP